MAFDPALAGRIRAALSFHPSVTEKSMFGSRAFLVEGRLVAAASGRGGLMLRVDPEVATELVESGRAQPFEMRGREIAGWLLVGEEQFVSEAALVELLHCGLSFVGVATEAKRARQPRRPVMW